jgi:putative two-component system response regulator
MARILIVDDESAIRRLLRRLLEDQDHDCTEAKNVAHARHALARDSFELVLCDMTMPGEPGLDLAREVLAGDTDTAVVMVTAHDDSHLVDQALDLGAYGYVTKPFKGSEILINVANALRRRVLELENRRHRRRLEETVEARTGELREAIGELEHFHEETIRRLSAAAELRDFETGQHIDRMSRYCALLAEKVGLEQRRVDLIRIASPMHDVGKIGIPDRILLKPGALTAAERRLMEGHTEIGYEILRGSEAELLQLAATLAWTHHERVDGTGYPRSLRGDQIPIEGRIAAVADVFDALTSTRPYRAALSVPESLELMHAGRGTQFDADVLDHFLDAFDEVLAIRTSATTTVPERSRAA